MSEMKKCPECNVENPKAANFCRKCRYEFPEATKEGTSLKPEIKYLRIRESQYVAGSTIHIEWDVDNYTKVELAGEDVTLHNDAELIVEKAIELQLVVSNDYVQTKQSVRVVPYSSPVIRRFSSSHSNVKAGKTTRLSWSVDYAKKIFLKSPYEEIDVTVMSELEISPANDTTYTLVAYAVDESISVSKEITIRVFHDVAINDFSSDIAQTLESQPVELRWDIDNADKIKLYPNDIDVTHQNSIKVFPNRAMTYRIVASNAISIKEALLNINVRPLPRLDVKVSDSLSRLEIPNCEIDLTPLTTSIKETDLDRWMLSPTKHSIAKKMCGNGLWNRLKKIVSLKIKLQ